MPVTDLSKILEESLQEADLAIYHPVSGMDLGIRIKVCSPDSERYQKLEREIKNRALVQARKQKNNQLSMEAIEESSMNLLVGSVVSWDGVVWGGQPLECTQENIRQLFEQFPFIRRQVDEFIGDASNFFAK